MSEDDIARVLNESYGGRGTTPQRVAEAVERAQAEARDRPRRPAPSTTARERFFKAIAEDIKRAEGS